MKKSFFVVFLIQIIEFFNNITSLIIEKPILFIISYDGFRSEYLDRNVTENLLEFRNNGVYTDYMLNVFPTKTFTNHHSIATGFYPDKHGIMANALYDSEQGFLNYKNRGYDLFHYNRDILPIWIVNQLYNGTSGCMMWPGSEFEYGNKTTCQYVEVYKPKMPFKDRVDTAISWLTKDDNPANLIMFYCEQPDKLAHMVGPDSSNVTDMVKQLDILTKYIQDKLIENNLINRTNVIHLSDHGMASVTPSKFINLTDYLEPNSVKFYGTSPVLQIVPENMTNLNVIYEHLKLMSNKNGNFKVYTNDDTLNRWHCKNLRRLGPIIAVANDDYAFQDMWDIADQYQILFNITMDNNSTYGVHGYDNKNILMHSYFMAKGPSFKSETKVEPFESVDLFNLFLNLLQINNQENEYSLKTDGDFQRIQYLLADYTQSLNWIKILVAVCLCAIVIIVVSIYFLHQYRRRQNYTVTC